MMGEVLFKAFISATVLFGLSVLVLCGFWIFSDPSGTVSGKYFDDSDIVCPKACVVTPDCWALSLDGARWWDEQVCVSKEYWDTVKVGDHYGG